MKRVVLSAILALALAPSPVPSASSHQRRPGRLRASPSEHDEHGRAEEVLCRHARRQRGQDRLGDRQQEIIKFPNVLIFFRPMQAPTGGSIGTTVNHIGFSVPDLRPLVAKIKANGFKMITDRLGRRDREGDRRHRGRESDDEPRVCARSGGREGRVRRSEDRRRRRFSCITSTSSAQKNTEMQAWYAKTFGAKMLPANPASAFVQDQLPGVFLNFTPSPTPTVGTTGRAIDHIGFEIKNLEAFTKKLEAAGHQAGSSLHQGARARHRDRVHQGSVGHEHRNDGRDWTTGTSSCRATG